MSRKVFGNFGAIALTALVLALPSQAQDQWMWPDKPENLQVLPKDWPGSRLRAPMRGFTSALGVGCSHCHVGEEGKPLSTYDFASDENPNKNRAREMLRMLESINGHLEKIEPSGDKPVNMWCHTCHSGRPRPMTLREELGETYRAKGLDAALTHYAQLRENYYGKGAYNFEGESALNSFGYSVLKNNDAEGAIRVFKLNAERFPESGNVWDSLAEAYMKAGHMKMAEKYYQKSIELDPRNQNAKDMLKKIEEEEGE
ncbi:c-type cytochrome [candidate division KSB1 bacterium]|nr:c-type cytochrome [candidate division KSB1 bacterium]NIS23890.1 c-type cytochrome [candidate division KSB1 bacterium]NIT70807.1 c-type cytochrome [candidate division KSB1 bacterium]NIU24539.1 c-type cytochrome [candidate division KSB1 bacterium]NIU94493.1 c-type cytochrome [candidate division KSB1 bacterium]